MKNLKIIVRNLSKSFKQGAIRITILKHITVQFEQCKSYAITGVSGTGKSTFLQLLSGLDKPDSGSICYNDQNISLLSAKELDTIHNKDVGLLFQQPYLIKELSILENIMLPGLIGGLRLKESIERALFLLDHIGLYSKIKERTAALSGGQQQRISLARALFNKPAFLIADEPTGSLDKKTADSIIELLLRCKSDWNMGLIISSHDKYVTQVMQKIYRLCECRLHEVKPFVSTNQMLKETVAGTYQENNQ